LNNRKPAKASKHARSPNKSQRATQARATQAIVRSPRNSRLRPVAAESDESSPERRNDANQETRLVENPAIALQDDYKQPVTDSDPKKSPFPLATANVQAYQAKLLEVIQANMQFAFEFAQRLAAIRSPVEYLSVIAAFTSKRIDMFRKYSKEFAELSTWR
jgi:Phasin protein